MRSLFAGVVLALLASLIVFSGMAKATELVMYDRAGCVWCERWKSEVGVVYPKTAEGRAAPLRIVHTDRLRAPEPFLKSPIIYTPTFIVVDEGREIGRIIGYSNDDMFWGQLGQILALKKNSPAASATKTST